MSVCYCVSKIYTQRRDAPNVVVVDDASHAIPLLRTWLSLLLLCYRIGKSFVAGIFSARAIASEISEREIVPSIRKTWKSVRGYQREKMLLVD